MGFDYSGELRGKRDDCDGLDVIIVFAVIADVMHSRWRLNANEPNAFTTL